MSTTNRFKRKSALTVPLYRHNVGVTALLLFTGDLRFVPLKSPGGKKGEPDKKPAPCLRATNLETGEQVDYIASKLVCETFKRTFDIDIEGADPKMNHHFDGLSGKALEIICSKREGKSYNDMTIYELVPDEISDADYPDIDPDLAPPGSKKPETLKKQAG